MLILVAVTVRTVVQSGLFGHAGKATSGYSMHQARERLGTTLAGAQTEKYTNKEYNENKYLDDYIKDSLPNSKIDSDIAIVDGWAFELDRSVPKIGQNLGKEGTFTYPTLEITKGTFSEQTLSIPIYIKAQEKEHGISKIEVILNGEVVHTFDDCHNSTDEISRTYTATQNDTYYVKVYSEINKKGSIEITEINKTPEIGDYVRYTPDKAENYTKITLATGGAYNHSIPQDTGLKWRILKINSNGTMELIADKPIGTSVSFQGMLGYNNGVYLLNDLCKTHYSSENWGATARSVNLLDLESRMNSEGLTKRNSYRNTSGSVYGTYGTCSVNPTVFPDIFLHTEPTTEGESLSYYDSPTTKTYTNHIGPSRAKQTYYNLPVDSEYYKDPQFFDLFDPLKLQYPKYWLATRSTEFFGNFFHFHLRYVYGAISGSRLATSVESTDKDNAQVRPVVFLPNTVELKYVPGTSEFEIVKK